MAKQVYTLDAELKESVQQVVRHYLQNFQPRPKRGRRHRGGGSSEPLHPQLAMVTEITQAGTSPHYSTSFTTSFTMAASAAHICIVRAVLIDVGDVDDPGVGFLTVLNPNGLSISELEFLALDVRKEGTPKVGEVVRVWTSDGEHVRPGEGDYENGEVVNNRHDIYCDALNPTDYLRGLETWNTSVEQFLHHDAASTEIDWVASTGIEGPEGPAGPEGPIGPEGPAGADGAVPTEGYAIDVEAPAVVHFDPTEITDFAAAFQVFMHTATENANRTSPPWKTVTGYNGAVDQMWWQRSGAFEFQTTADYNAANRQFLWHQTGAWQWETISNYDGAKRQLLGHNSGAWELREANSVTIKVPTSIELNITGTAPNQVLEVKLNYTEYTMFGVAGDTGNMTDNVEADPCS